MISEDIHGHEVLRLVGSADVPFTRMTLVDHVLRTWGANARFHTCSSSNLGIDDLLDFLMSRGKIVVNERGHLSIDQGQICETE